MDFYAARWRDAARRMSSYIDSYPEPIILINSSFTLANPRFQSREKEVDADARAGDERPGILSK